MTKSGREPKKLSGGEAAQCSNKQQKDTKLQRSANNSFGFVLSSCSEAKKQGGAKKRVQIQKKRSPFSYLRREKRSETWLCLPPLCDLILSISSSSSLSRCPPAPPAPPQHLAELWVCPRWTAPACRTSTSCRRCRASTAPGEWCCTSRC